MAIISIATGKSCPLKDRKGNFLNSGIVKSQTTVKINIGYNGLEGDEQADRKVHGGEFRAVSAYPVSHYKTWAREENRPDLTYGYFGDNFTIEGGEEDRIMVGDFYRYGNALLEVTYPRIPCIKLGIRMADPDFPNRFLSSKRTGFFLRVIEPGYVQVGDKITQIKSGVGNFSILETLNLFYGSNPDLNRLHEISKIKSLPGEWRKKAEHLAAKKIKL